MQSLVEIFAVSLRFRANLHFHFGSPLSFWLAWFPFKCCPAYSAISKQIHVAGVAPCRLEGDLVVRGGEVLVSGEEGTQGTCEEQYNV